MAVLGIYTQFINNIYEPQKSRETIPLKNFIIRFKDHFNLNRFYLLSKQNIAHWKSAMEPSFSPLASPLCTVLIKKQMITSDGASTGRTEAPVSVRWDRSSSSSSLTGGWTEVRLSASNC